MKLKAGFSKLNQTFETSLLEEDQLFDAQFGQIQRVSGGANIVVSNSAKIGQTVVVNAVDENGKPTEWKTADFPPSVVNAYVHSNGHLYIVLSNEVEIDAGYISGVNTYAAKLGTAIIGTMKLGM